MAEMTIQDDGIDPEKEALAVRRAHDARPLLERWVEEGPESAEKRVTALVKTLEVLRVASIKATYPTDWLIHETKNEAGEITKQVGYLQDCGAERAGKPWGIEVGQPIIELENHTDGTFSYHMLAEGWSKVTGERVESAMGSRWSGSPFFRRSVAADEKIDPTVVRKSAYANLHGRIVRALAGLSQVPLDTLRTAGLDPAKLQTIGYDRGSRGGSSRGAGLGAATEAVVTFGNAKGTKVGDLDEKDLGWYIAAYQKNVTDPERARFKEQNQRVLDALLKEKEQRSQKKDHAATQAGVEGEETKTERGQQIGTLWAMLSDAAPQRGLELFGELCKQSNIKPVKAITDLSDEDLAKLCSLDEAAFKAVADALPKGKK